MAPTQKKTNNSLLHLIAEVIVTRAILRSVHSCNASNEEAVTVPAIIIELFLVNPEAPYLEFTA